MDGNSNYNPGNLEDDIRRMILLGSSTRDEVPAAPRVRLPPPSAPQHPQHQQQGLIRPQGGQTQHDQNVRWQGQTSASPISPHIRGFPLPQIVSSGPPSGHAVAQLPPSQMPQYQGQHPASMCGQPPIQQHAPPPHPPHPNHIPHGPAGASRPHGGQRSRGSRQIEIDPDAYQRGGPNHSNGRPGPRTLYDPNVLAMHQINVQNDFLGRQGQYLEDIAKVAVPSVTMSHSERAEKLEFRQRLQELCNEVCNENPHLPEVSLECFGSFQSGFASAGSDMDLVIVVQGQGTRSEVFSLLEDDLPRALEAKLLRSGHGARLLTRTRVPIIKVCQIPGEDFLGKLREEREKWDLLPEHKKYPHLFPYAEDDAGEGANIVIADVTGRGGINASAGKAPMTSNTAGEKPAGVTNGPENTNKKSSTPSTTTEGGGTNGQQPDMARREQGKTWTRERKAGPLDFPKNGVGIQCDINFFNPLGLHNTHLLRCYSSCDKRVRPLVLFVKSWAKARGINSSYSGTLNSYGYVLMVLHYLINVTVPPVLPNLQSPWRPNPGCTASAASKGVIDGWTVEFWRNEDEIISAYQNRQLSNNRESLGSLLAGFFKYYSSMGNGPQFRWTHWVLSVRSQRGILTKDSKGWIKAVTEEGEGKRIQHRYLFCIEDPFELSHNVARTVTHNGIVAIRDEFRRAHRILNDIGQGGAPKDGELLDTLDETDGPAKFTAGLKPSNDDPIQGEAAPLQACVEPNFPKKQSKAQHKQVSDFSINNIRVQGGPSKSTAKSLDIADQDAFPTLGKAAATKTRRNKSNDQNMSGISGSKAQAYLEEFRRKKAEEQAESTAMGAAEAVLNGDD